MTSKVYRTFTAAPRFSLTFALVHLIFYRAGGAPAVLSEAHIYRLYAQGAERIFRLVRQLECATEDIEALLARTPHPRRRLSRLHAVMTGSDQSYFTGISPRWLGRSRFCFGVGCVAKMINLLVEDCIL